MPDQNPFPHQPAADRRSPSDDPHGGNGEGEPPLPREQRDRLAELVARGECSLPEGLSPRDRLPLERRVSELRRARLVRFLARQIALDIHGARGIDAEIE